MIEIALAVLSLVAMVDILPFEGSTLSLLIVAAIVIVALAILWFRIPLIIAVVVAIVLGILLFGGIRSPEMDFYLPAWKNMSCLRSSCSS